MQLAVNSDKSKFIECSDKFNHFIYELKRSMLGPMNELCNIWMQSDPRATFYSTKADELNQRTEKKPHLCEGLKGQINFPFKCGLCREYYSNIVEIKKHQLCSVCDKNICTSCQFKGMKNYVELERLIPELPDPKGEQNY